VGHDYQLDDDHFHDECGIFGIYGHREAANIAYLGLFALQHRGQESAGIVTALDGKQYQVRQMGLVTDIFKKPILEQLPGDIGIGHVRYSTSGGSLIKNAQPFHVTYSKGPLAIAHNGNLTNAARLRRELEAQGSIFQSDMDTEVLAHLVARSKGVKTIDRIVDALSQVRGAYSCLFMTGDEIIAVRDPYGFRPLVLGYLGDAIVLASETCAFDLIGATVDRELRPGEIVSINRYGVNHITPFPKTMPKQCVFELVYFARPDSIIFNQSVYDFRRRAGRILAEEHPADADLVISVPDSGLFSALGVAEQLKLPFEMGMIRNHYIGRTFIEPTQSIRHFGVKLKLNPVASLLDGKRVVIVDDSIVRGTTSRKIVRMLREAGAREVHMRVSSPPVTGPCYFGIDTPQKSELIASTHTVAQIAESLGVDSLGYLSIRGLRQAAGAAEYPFCDACFSGNYPMQMEE